MKRNKRVLYYILMSAGILGVIDTISLLFYTNINVGTLLPGFAGVICIIYAGLKLWVYKDKPVIKSHILRYLVVAGLAVFVTSFILLESLILYNSHSQQNIRTDYLIILGAGIKGETVSLTLKERLDKGVDYLNRYPDTRVIVSGGKGFEETISEAEAMKRYLVKKGIEPERIITEDKSTSTMENFKLSRKVLSDINEKDINQIMIVTNDFHMMRAKMLARRNEFEPYGITCSTPISVRFNCYIREYFALVKSYLFDR